MKGKGLVNNLINHLPVELHIPGYNYCGPGTKLEKRLCRGDQGVNQLDEYCKEHDIAYLRTENLEQRHKADKKLMEMSKKLSHSSKASRGEKLASWFVNKAMKTKLKLGAGKRKTYSMKKMLSKISSKLKTHKTKNEKDLIKTSYGLAKKIVKESKSKIKIPRIIPLPKIGGFLPLIPIFAGLSALGGLAGGAAGIAKAVNDYKVAKNQLKENERHNKVMEAISIGKGLHLKPYKKGFAIKTVQNSKN